MFTFNATEHDKPVVCTVSGLKFFVQQGDDSYYVPDIINVNRSGNKVIVQNVVWVPSENTYDEHYHSYSVANPSDVKDNIRKELGLHG